MDWINSIIRNCRIKYIFCLVLCFLVVSGKAQTNINGLYSSGLPIGFEVWNSKHKKMSSRKFLESKQFLSINKIGGSSNHFNANNKIYFRSASSGNWNLSSIWESSLDNINWQQSKTIPIEENCIVLICSPYLVSTEGLSNIKIDEVKVEAGAELDNSSSVELQGNLYCDGIFTNSSTDSRLLLNGIKDQVVEGRGKITTYVLEINKPAGEVFLKNNIKVDGNLNLVSGIVYTSNDARILLNENATATNASEKSFINGPLQKRGNHTFSFPIGKLNNYKPVSINTSENAGINDVITAEYFGNDFQNSRGLVHTGQCEYWTLDLDARASQKKVTISWDGNRCGFINFPVLRFARFSTSVWLDQGNMFMIGSSDPGSINTGQSAMTIAAINVTTPLRITLLSFNAAYKGRDVKLSWVAASEINNQDFSIEHSFDGNNFEPIILQSTSGKNEISRSYSNDEINPRMNISYFRLKQIDFDGAVSYSDIIPIRIQRL